jgi:arylsulfatase
MTGCYPQRIGSDPPVSGAKLPQGTMLIPHYLKPLGYRTYHSGKWHVPLALLPCTEGGFDRSYDLRDPDRHFYPNANRYFGATPNSAGAPHLLDDKPLPAVKPEDNYYSTTAIADYAIAQLREHTEKTPDAPFFSYVAFLAPHFPLHARQNDIDKYRDTYRVGWDVIRQNRHERLKSLGIVNCSLSPLEQIGPAYNPGNITALGDGEILMPQPWTQLTDAQKTFQAAKMSIHAAMVDCVDQEVGRIIAQLKEMNAYDNTIIFFLSDNGADASILIRGDGHDPSEPLGSAKTFLCLGPGWSTASNTPFRLHKVWCNEGGISTPLVVHCPKLITLAHHNKLRTRPAHVVDFVPTILELAGATVPDSFDGAKPNPFDGVSFRNSLLSDEITEEETHKIFYFSHEGNRAIRIGDYKLVSIAKTRQGDNEWRLYDLSQDRSEQNDLSEKMPEKRKEMMDIWNTMDNRFKEESGEKVRRM